MKTNNLLLGLCAIVLAACTQNPPTQTLSTEELQNRFSECIAYLSDNYEKGDILRFENGNGETVEMRVVTSVVMFGIIDPSEEEGDDEENGKNNLPKAFVPQASNNKVSTTSVYLEERKHGKTIFDIAIALLPTGEKRSNVSIRTDAASDGSTAPDVPSETKNTILLQDQNSKNWCLLERGIGIIQLADTLGHTWKLVEQ